MFIGSLITYLMAMHGAPAMIETDGNHRVYSMADSCRWEVVYYPDSVCCDSVLVIQSACVPVCNSAVAVYDKDGGVLRHIAAPDTMMLPYATIENGEIVWEDHTIPSPIAP